MFNNLLMGTMGASAGSRFEVLDVLYPGTNRYALLSTEDVLNGTNGVEGFFNFMAYKIYARGIYNITVPLFLNKGMSYRLGICKTDTLIQGSTSLSNQWSDIKAYGRESDSPSLGTSSEKSYTIDMIEDARYSEEELKKGVTFWLVLSYSPVSIMSNLIKLSLSASQHWGYMGIPTAINKREKVITNKGSITSVSASSFRNSLKRDYRVSVGTSYMTADIVKVFFNAGHTVQKTYDNLGDLKVTFDITQGGSLVDPKFVSNGTLSISVGESNKTQDFDNAVGMIGNPIPIISKLENTYRILSDDTAGIHIEYYYD